VGLYLLAALCAGLAHYGFEWFPYMGASGAVNGVMGAFLVFFPRNDVTVFWVLWYRPGVSRISSGWVILFWIVWDVFTLVRGGGGQVALWAHVGGFAIGFLTALLCVLRGWIKPTEDEETLFEVLRRGREGPRRPTKMVPFTAGASARAARPPVSGGRFPGSPG